MLRLINIVSLNHFVVKLIESKLFKVIIVLTMVLNTVFNLNLKDNLLHIYFLNVGQGDSILIRTPDSKYVLIDGGPDDKVLEELGKHMPFWIKRLDYIFVSHPDADHLAGIVEVLKNYEVNNVIYSGEEASTSLFKEYTQYVEKTNALSNSYYLGDKFIIGCCAIFEIVWPSKGGWDDEGLSTNNSSLAFFLNYKNFDIFLGGDLDAKYEDIIVKNFPKNVDVLKVGHHGSKNSTSVEFLSRLDPEYAFITAGKNNKYSHPHTETIDKLEGQSISYFINYDYKSLLLKSDGNNLMIYNR